MFVRRFPMRRSSQQCARMVPQVILHERGHEVIAVVVALVESQFERRRARAARFGEQMRLQLLVQESVGEPLIDQDRAIVAAGRGSVRRLCAVLRSRDSSAPHADVFLRLNFQPL